LSRLKQTVNRQHAFVITIFKTLNTHQHDKFLNKLNTEIQEMAWLGI
jgi:hypothetical protein